MLFIDNVISLEENQIITESFVDPKANYFKGHFPDMPVMPGVLIGHWFDPSTAHHGFHGPSLWGQQQLAQRRAAIEGEGHEGQKLTPLAEAASPRLSCRAPQRPRIRH